MKEMSSYIPLTIEKFNSSHDGLPFPLNETALVKTLIGFALALNLLVGIKLRTQIISYLHTVDIKKNPINYFFWFDQVNGSILGLYIAFTLAALLTEFPLSDIADDSVCNWTDLLGCLYLSGATAWSFNIALYRTFLIKVSAFFNDDNNKRRKDVVFVFLIVLGLANSVIPASVAAYLDRGFG